MSNLNILRSRHSVYERFNIISIDQFSRPRNSLIVFRKSIQNLGDPLCLRTSVMSDPRSTVPSSLRSLRTHLSIISCLWGWTRYVDLSTGTVPGSSQSVACRVVQSTRFSTVRGEVFPIFCAELEDLSTLFAIKRRFFKCYDKVGL